MDRGFVKYIKENLDKPALGENDIEYRLSRIYKRVSQRKRFTLLHFSLITISSVIFISFVLLSPIINKTFNTKHVDVVSTSVDLDENEEKQMIEDFDSTQQELDELISLY